MASCPSCKGTEELHEEYCPEYKPPVDALQFQIYQKHQQIEAMAQDLIRQQKQIEMLQGAFGDMAATIRRLTEERLGSEKSLYEQAKGLGIGISPQDSAHDPERITRAFHSLERAIRAEGYNIFIDPDGVYSVEKDPVQTLYDQITKEDPATGD